MRVARNMIIEQSYYLKVRHINKTADDAKHTGIANQLKPPIMYPGSA